MSERYSRDRHRPSADSALVPPRRRCASSSHRVSFSGGINMKYFTGLILCGLIGVGVARADGRADTDAVVDWNQITVDAVTVGRPGPIGLVDIALVHVAVHDAVQAIEKRFEPYHFEMERAYGRRSAAVAAAAHDVLVGMYPAQAATLDPIYYDYL